jgi:Holliday junction resolvasome RuvABC endonuclease subunit
MNLPDRAPDLVLIEGLAFMARNTTALVQLAGLNYLMRILLDEFEWPFVIVAPSSLKKFITQKGNADKNVMMMTVYKDYGHEFMDDNVCDGYSLAVCGQAVLGNPLKDLTIPQKEVINLLKSQL